MTARVPLSDLRVSVVVLPGCGLPVVVSCATVSPLPLWLGFADSLCVVELPDVLLACAVVLLAALFVVADGDTAAGLSALSAVVCVPLVQPVSGRAVSRALSVTATSRLRMGVYSFVVLSKLELGGW